MLLALANWLATDVRSFNVFGYITLRAVLATMTALVISFVVGPCMIRKLTAIQDRPGGARRRPADAPDQGRHADHGRRADPGRRSRSRRCCGAISRNRFVWVVLLGDARLRRDRLGRRLSQGRAPQSERASPAREVLWQSRDRRSSPRSISRSRSRRPRTRSSCSCSHAWLGSGFNLDLPPKADLIVPFFKTVSYPLGRVGLHLPVVLRDRRRQQRGQPYRRPRRTGHHAHRDGWRRARHLRLRHGPRRFLDLPVWSRTFPARASSPSSAPRSPARAWAFCGSTPIPPRCSWATSARWRSARALGAPSRSSCGRRSCCSSWAAYSWSKPCRW